MSDTSVGRRSRGTTESSGQSHPGTFRTWLRAALGGRQEANWRDTIEELIEDQQSEEDGPADASIASHERTLLGNILSLRDRTAYDVMVPRADIVAVEVDTQLPAVLELLAENSHSRLPVYRETLDDIVGMLHIKDVLAALVKGGDPPPLASLVREVLIIAPSMPVLDLLLQMRQGRRHMALVIDEFGGIDGLITIEDLVEEIVGEIEDEHDEIALPQLEERPDGSFLADSRVTIEDFEERVGSVLTEEEREDNDTLGGLVVSLAGRIPVRGEVLSHPSGLEFEVVDADPRRIRRLLVRRTGASPAVSPDG